MKVSKREILFLSGSLGILAAVCSFVLIFQPVMGKADDLELENQQLRMRINDLSAKMENKDVYLSETEKMNRETDSIFGRFPVDVREEDAIMLAVSQELAAPMMVNSISIGACEPVSLPGGEAEDAVVNGSDHENSPLVLMARNVTISYLVSYEGLKRGIKNISVQDNRMSINHLTVTYDESTGLLTGTASVDMYCVPGQPGKEYVTPDFSSVLLGTDNIFGSVEIHGEDGSIRLAE